MEDPTFNASLVTAFQENWKAYFWERKSCTSSYGKEYLDADSFHFRLM